MLILKKRALLVSEVKLLIKTWGLELFTWYQGPDALDLNNVFIKLINIWYILYIEIKWIKLFKVSLSWLIVKMTV